MISVIIPVYNAELFIRDCLDSILNQTYRDFEIVAVNDGSTDSTPEILNEYGKKDSRIKIYSQENSGVSAARNTGLKKACGDYITFVDADDDLLPTALSDMAELMKDDVDFVVCSHNDVRFKTKPYIENEVTYTAGELNDNFIKFDEVTWWPWGKMLRRSIIEENKLEYDKNISFGEDHIFNLLYAKHITGKVVVSGKIVYNYNCIRGGLCSKYYDDMHRLQKYVYLKIADYFGGSDSILRKYQKYYAGNYLKGCVEYYIAWLSLAKAAQKLKETFDVFNDITDDEIIKDFFTEKQYELIKENNFKKLAVNYTINNPRQTIVRKYGRKARIFLEFIQKKVKR